MMQRIGGGAVAERFGAPGSKRSARGYRIVQSQQRPVVVVAPSQQFRAMRQQDIVRGPTRTASRGLKEPIAVRAGGGFGGLCRARDDRFAGVGIIEAMIGGEDVRRMR